MGWTDARIAQLKTLWQEGLPASEIAKRFGDVSRNAVIGKVYRLGLSGRGAPSAPRGVTPPLPRRIRRQARALPRPPARLARAVGIAGGRPDLAGLVVCEDLVAHLCRWPIGDPRDPGFRFCGRDAGDQTYCAPHAEVAYASPRARPENLVRSLRRYL